MLVTILRIVTLDAPCRSWAFCTTVSMEDP